MVLLAAVTLFGVVVAVIAGWWEGPQPSVSIHAIADRVRGARNRIDWLSLRPARHMPVTVLNPRTQNTFQPKLAFIPRS